MLNYTTLKTEIEEEYDACCRDSAHDLNKLYEKLYVFLNYMVRKFMGSGYLADEAEDIVSETMEVILTKALPEFEKKEAAFSTYCAAIAHNKVNNFRKKYDRIVFDVDNEWKIEEHDKNGMHLSPEHQLILLESRLEQIALAKKYIQMLMDWKQKPYKTVSCVFSMLLFHRYHPRTRELASPKWAYEELELHTVEDGAERFLKEMSDWIPNSHFLWSAAFIDQLDEPEGDMFISDIVFGERFKRKDFENWSLRLRQAVKKQLLEEKEAKDAAFEL